MTMALVSPLTSNLVNMKDFRPPHHTTTKEEWEFIFQTQIHNCAQLKNTELQRFVCVDSTGNKTTKYVIEYND
ncbi:hypothetical protein Syn7803C22_40 [Synechococcus phage ACG-2014f]|uniref:Uncharacterized protein n=2 Tax=Synechococcus phage ACG-2014f TaxID=1493511 RepID=A0A0E3G3M9_9CAUD|nr:hypothetical protein Syn7803C22_40 [Synechococcus phage ACG-2014f]